MVRRVLTVPALLEPLIFQPLMLPAPALTLRRSMTPSLPPAGPRVRNSLMTTVVDTACPAWGDHSPAASKHTRPRPAAISAGGLDRDPNAVIPLTPRVMLRHCLAV